MKKNILFYGSGITSASHVWMRRQFEFLKPHIHTVIEHEVPDIELDKSINLKLLPGRKNLGNKPLQLISDIFTDIQHRRIIKNAATTLDVEKIIVHFLFNAVPYRAVWEQVKKPVFIHCHGLDVTWEKTGASRKWRKLWWGDYVEEVQKLPGNVTFVANSEITKNRLEQIDIDPWRIKVVTPGVPVPKIIPDRSVQSRPLKILFIGRLTDVKGPVKLLQAFDIASSKGLDANLIVAGDGYLFEVCKKFKEKSVFGSRITLLGAVSMEKGEELRLDADIFTAHSCKGERSKQEESFGVAFTEAMAAGLPVVTGNSGSLPTLVRHGIDGFLFEPGDIEEHAKCLLQLQNKPELRLKMGLAAFKRARSIYSTKKEMKELYNLYNLNG